MATCVNHLPGVRWHSPRPLALALVLLASPALFAQIPKAPLRGTVVDERGRPVAGAAVSGVVVMSGVSNTGTPITSFTRIKERTTDAAGAFTIEVSKGKPAPAVYLRARRGDAFTAKPVALRDGALDQPITLTISAANTRSLTVRVLDEEGRPIAGATVTAQHRSTLPGAFADDAAEPMVGPGAAAWTTDVAGRFASSRSLDPDGGYRLEMKADGFLAAQTAWKPAGTNPVAFGDVVLKRVRPLEGRVLDRQGKPVAGARVVRADGQSRAEGKTDADGRFRLSTALVVPGFLFVEKAGYRFHGQRCDEPGPLAVTLTRRDEPAGPPRPTLPPALPRAERKALAERLLNPYLKRVLAKDGDDDRLRPLELLAKLDAGRLLEELAKRPFKSAWYDSYVRRAAAKALLSESFEEARSLVDSMPDPGFRCMSYLDLYDAVSDARRAEKLTLLNQALLHSQRVEANDHRVINLAMIARRLWALGEKDRATKLLREGQAIAKELPTAAWPGYARGAFAEDLALIDRPTALELMKDLKDPFEYARHHGNLAHKLAGVDPAEAERVLGMLLQAGNRSQSERRDQYAVRVCYRMTPADLPRATRIAETVMEPYFKAQAFGAIAQALARSRPQEALRLLDRAFEILVAHAASGRDQFNGLFHAAAVAGLMLPVAEQIHPTLVAEFMWRTVALRSRPDLRDANRDGMEGASIGALALVVARYDRTVALTLIEEASKQPRTEYYGRGYTNLAAALADPRRAVALIEQLADESNKDYARESVAGMLLAEGETAWRAVHRALGQWYVDDEDL